jgi:hypothetical protein
MINRLSSLKRAFLALAFVAAVSATPALAASPTISDAGSGYWTARVSGSGFTPSGNWITNQAVVWVLNVDPYGNYDWRYSYASVSADYCYWWWCYGGGQISVSIDTAPLQCGSRSAIAQDLATGQWSYWIPIDCA